MLEQAMAIDGYLERILRARVYDVAIESPLDAAPKLSARLANRVLLKREDLQPVFSFKLRGAYNKVAQLSLEEQRRGIVTASAGNHAQGVGLAARALGIEATIVMPVTTPTIKVDAVRRLGAQTLLVGDAYDEAYDHALTLSRDTGMTFVHPYDDPEVIAGQGTVAMEILRQHRGTIDAIFVPVGGGGLVAGVAAFTKHLYPDIKVIGVEPTDAGCLHAALSAGRRVRLDQVGLFADGASVREVGAEPFRIARALVDEVLLVDTDQICAAIKDVFDEVRAIVEPAGALAVAGLKAYAQREGCRDRTLVAINSGANMSFDRLRHVVERAELGEQREAILAVTIAEEPGAFKSFCQLLGKVAITEFNYRFGRAEEAHVFVGIALTPGAGERQAIIDQLRAEGLSVIDLTANEMAKVHARFIVGGRAEIEHERLFRFEFPERPGALMEFLTRLGGRWNISLFHYRNHGAAFARVLVGLSVPPAENPALAQFLTDVRYPHVEETDNPASHLFLR